MIDYNFHLQQVEDQGYTLLERVVPLDFVERIRRRLFELAEAERANGSGWVYFNGTSQRLFNLMNKDTIFHEALLFEPVLEMMERILGHGFIMSNMTGNLLGPGAPEQPLHADTLAPVPQPYPEFPLYATAIWFLDDWTAEGGAIKVVPRSHKLRRQPEHDRRYPDEINVSGPKGSMIVQHGCLWHGSGANRGNSWRAGLLPHFGRSYVRPQEDSVVSVRKELVEAAPPRIRQLLGFNVRGFVDGPELEGERY